MRLWVPCGVALVAAGAGGAIAACGGDDAPAAAPQDAGVDSSPTYVSQGNDDAGGAGPDDAAADAPLPFPNVASFGERPDAGVQGVTTDTEIRELAGSRPANFGGLASLTIDSNDGKATGDEKVALLRFDLSKIPATRKVAKATLALWSGGTSGCATKEANTVGIFRMLEAWTEGDEKGDAGVANYSQRMTGVAWKTAGVGAGSRDAKATVTFAPNVVTTEFTVVLTTLVAGWVADPTTNFGVMLRMNATDGDGACFYSSENTAAERRPLLTVELTAE